MHRITFIMAWVISATVIATGMYRHASARDKGVRGKALGMIGAGLAVIAGVEGLVFCFGVSG